MSWNIEVDGGSSVRLPTAGKYCDRDIIVTAAGSAEADTYDGEYTVTPKVESQTLETAGKLMDDNVTIKEIPYYNVSNNSGGSTVYIGREIE